MELTIFAKLDFTKILMNFHRKVYWEVVFDGFFYPILNLVEQIFCVNHKYFMSPFNQFVGQTFSYGFASAINRPNAM